jgi:hypothetical protein
MMNCGIEDATELICGIEDATELICGIEDVTELICGIGDVTELICGIEDVTELICGIEDATELIIFEYSPLRVSTRDSFFHHLTSSRDNRATCTYLIVGDSIPHPPPPP